MTVEKPQDKTVYIVMVNTDLTEGRGYNVPLAICETEATAVRLAYKKDVQGTNGSVHPFPAIFHHGTWCAPFHLQKATDADKKLQQQLDARQEALARAKAAGLSESDIELLAGKP